MKITLQILSWIALAMTVIPSVVFLGGSLDLSAVKWWMLPATLLWFVVTPFWMERAKS